MELGNKIDSSSDQFEYKELSIDKANQFFSNLATTKNDPSAANLKTLDLSTTKILFNKDSNVSVLSVQSKLNPNIHVAYLVKDNILVSSLRSIVILIILFW